MSKKDPGNWPCATQRQATSLPLKTTWTRPRKAAAIECFASGVQCHGTIVHRAARRGASRELENADSDFWQARSGNKGRQHHAAAPSSDRNEEAKLPITDSAMTLLSVVGERCKEPITNDFCLAISRIAAQANLDVFLSAAKSFFAIGSSCNDEYECTARRRRHRGQARTWRAKSCRSAPGFTQRSSADLDGEIATRTSSARSRQRIAASGREGRPQGCRPPPLATEFGCSRCPPW